MRDLDTIVPPLLGLKGNLEMTLASRLSTQVPYFKTICLFILLVEQLLSSLNGSAVLVHVRWKLSRLFWFLKVLFMPCLVELSPILYSEYPDLSNSRPRL